ncbi:hypothetical protein ACP275_09G139400 [Erythranthe tilingii]
MKSHLSITASFLIVLVLVLNSHVQESQAIRVLLANTQNPVSTVKSSSQSLEGLHSKEKNPYKKEKSSYRRVPPSRSNPTQNK